VCSTLTKLIFLTPDRTSFKTSDATVAAITVVEQLANVTDGHHMNRRHRAVSNQNVIVHLYQMSTSALSTTVDVSTSVKTFQDRSYVDVRADLYCHMTARLAEVNHLALCNTCFLCRFNSLPIVSIGCRTTFTHTHIHENTDTHINVYISSCRLTFRRFCVEQLT